MAGMYVTNGTAAGQVFPAKANEAYTIIKGRKSSSVRVADSREIVANGAALMLADKVRALAIVPSPAAPNRRFPPAG